MLKEYFERLFRLIRGGDAREESYYSALEQLLLDYAKSAKHKVQVTVLPKKTEAGNPDFRVWDGKRNIYGYIEAKDPAKEKNLEVVAQSEQLQRYLGTFPNVILTDFFEFRLYRAGQLMKRVITGRPFIARSLKLVPPVEHEAEFLELLEQFFSFSAPRAVTAKQLALELANRTRFLHEQIIGEQLKEEKEEGVQVLEAFYAAFKHHLMASLDLKQFSNLFAQTITYGLFAARSRTEGDFNRKLAYDSIPPTVGILRDVFKFVSTGPDLPKQMEVAVDDIAAVLDAADVKKIIDSFHREGKGRDPIVHFYETFLAAYDPKERERRGVYYTPEPVVGYIVRSVHKLLKEKFSKEDGFATSGVTVLDPAAGTLTFPAEAIRQAVAEYTAKYGPGNITGLIRDHVLEDFYAFELMMAPYAVGHLKIGFVLDECGVKLQKERFKLYLTNTLDFERDTQTSAGPHEEVLAKEAAAAMKVKQDVPVMVVMGNPPYSGVSENKGPWISSKIEDYKFVDGKPLGERKHWLQDDYVKFYRFAQWKIEQTGQGVLGFITNHAWLDNPTFRGMRASILQTFDELYILNLHGSTLKKEKTPAGGKDENVFDIQPGVAIAILVKRPGVKQKRVFYADQWGLREEKYAWLDMHDVAKTKWQELKPQTPNYFLVPRDETGAAEYDKFNKVTEIFPVNSTGVLTGRDEFVIDMDKPSLEARLRVFRDSKDSDDFIKQAYGLKDKPNYKWFVGEARKELQKLPDWEKHFTKILYRPFDERWIYYHPAVVFWPREDVMRHMMKPNLCLLTSRMTKGEFFQHALVSEIISEVILLSSKTSNNSFVFPLYLYPKAEKEAESPVVQGMLALSVTQPSLRAKKGKQPNINEALYQKLEQVYQAKLKPEDIFYYIYAVLYSNTYRKKYSEFLKSDFPRVPFTADYKLFQKLAVYGEELVELHLLESKDLAKPTAKFEGRGSGSVEKREYDEKQGRVWVNTTQYFNGITPEVWNYHIGGYQILDKWLKDRKGRVLSAEDVKHYCRVATALARTIEVEVKIDELYLGAEKNPC